MARGKMDVELLALARMCKIIEELEDTRAQARIVSFLMMRFTSAGEQNLPSEERAKHFKLSFGEDAPDPRQMNLPGTEGGTPGAAPTRPATATDTRPATPHATPPVAGRDGAGTGLETGIAGTGNGGPITDMASKTMKKKPKPAVIELPTFVDDDDEVEVEI